VIAAATQGLEHFQLEFMIPLLTGLAVALDFQVLGFNLRLQPVKFCIVVGIPCALG